MPLMILIILVLLAGCGDPVVVVIEPSKPVLTSPFDSEQPSTVQLNWSASLRAESYDVYLGKTLGTMTPIVQNITSTFYDVTGLDPTSLYYWKVVAKNNAGITPSDAKVFSTQALRSGNYIEIRDTATNANSEFEITLFGNVANVRAIQVILTFDDTKLELAPNGTVNDLELLNAVSDALPILEVRENSIVVSISKNTNFTLNQEAFLSITCDAKALTGVTQITLAEGSRIIDANLDTVSFNKSDKGFVFIK